MDANNRTLREQPDADPEETREWLDSLEYVLEDKGTERATYLFERLRDRLAGRGAPVSAALNTPYINTIPAAQEPAYPGNLEIERRIRSYVRWNAMAMVVKGNKEHAGIGGHISTFASAATLYEVAFNHFFRGKDAPQGGDQVYFQGHAVPAGAAGNPEQDAAAGHHLPLRRHHDAVMGFGSGMDLVHRVGGGGNGGVKTESDFGGRKIVVNGFGHAHDLHVGKRSRLCSRKRAAFGHLCLV